MRRNIFLSIICVLSIFLTTGCSKEKIDSEKFLSILQENEYITYSQSKEVISPDTKELYIGNKGDDILIEYYTFVNEEFAKKYYESKIDNYDNISVKKTRLMSNGTNYNKYTLVANDKFFFLSRIDDTLIILISDEDKKNESEDIINKLGY